MIICVGHAFMIVGFASKFNDTDYDERWDYCCISGVKYKHQVAEDGKI